MTNRQMIMVKLIQLSDEQFAQLLYDEKLSCLTNDLICRECGECNNHECLSENSINNCSQLNLVEWLQKQAS